MSTRSKIIKAEETPTAFWEVVTPEMQSEIKTTAKQRWGMIATNVIKSSARETQRLSGREIVQRELMVGEAGDRDADRDSRRALQIVSQVNTLESKVTLQCSPGMTKGVKPTHPIRAKSTVGAVNDPYEQEADLVPKEVVDRIYSPISLQNRLLYDQELNPNTYRPHQKVAVTDTLVQRANGGGGRNHGGRYRIGLRLGDRERTVMYLRSWIPEIIDYLTNGSFYDAVHLSYALLGENGAMILWRIEEILHFIQHHPWIQEYLIDYAPYIAAYLSVPLWLVRIILSRGHAADSIGTYLTLLIMPSWLHPYANYIPIS